jgi:ferric-dicitrate binding protein FerR (iron transport regulator)
MQRFEDQSLIEAAEWFACRRRGVMTLQERADYDAWCLDPANCAAMSEVERLWGLAGLPYPKVSTSSPTPAARLTGFARSALVAILCIASLGAGIISLRSHSEFWNRLDWSER